MRFSIIIPVYNAEEYIRNCLESVLFQNFCDYEIIIINDGSTDMSGELCKRYMQNYPSIKYFWQKNAGPSAARNYGIRCASGEYLLFLDADDEIETGCLAYLDGIISQKKTDVVISTEKVCEKGKHISLQPLVLDPVKIHLSKEAALKELSDKRFTLLTHKVVLKRSILIENNLFFDISYRVGEDILLVVQALCKCQSFYLNPKPYYVYHIRDGSIMRTISFARIWDTTGICEYLYHLALRSPECEKQLLYTTINMLIIGFTKYYRCFSEDQKQKTKEWMKANKYILKAVKNTHSATSLAAKVIGPVYAFLLAGYIVGLRK